MTIYDPYEEEDEEKLRRMEKLANRLEKESLPKDLTGVDISTFIQSCTETASLAKLYDGHADASQLAAIDMYAYLRDEMGAKTVGDAVEYIRQGKVEESVVKRWIDEEAYHQKHIYSAIQEGYPKLKLPYIETNCMTDEEFEEMKSQTEDALRFFKEEDKDEAAE